MADPKALVVDFGGVLTTPMQDSFVAFAEASGIELQDLVRVAMVAYTDEGSDNLVEDLETGRMSEAEFSKAFAQRLVDATGVPIDHEDLIRRMFGGLRLEESMFELVADVRAAGFITALLSNSWGVADYPLSRLEEVMDHVFISGEMGLRKPQVEIFEATADRIGVAHDEIVFVDDHPGHLKAAQALGWTTVLHRSPEHTIAEVRGFFAL